MPPRTKAKQVNTVIETRQFKFEGHEYIANAIGNDSNYRIEHSVTDGKTGVTKTLDFTPYCFMSKIDFEKFVRLGMPGRQVAYRPLSSTDLRSMYKRL